MLESNVVHALKCIPFNGKNSGLMGDIHVEFKGFWEIPGKLGPVFQETFKENAAVERNNLILVIGECGAVHISIHIVPQG